MDPSSVAILLEPCAPKCAQSTWPAAAAAQAEGLELADHATRARHKHGSQHHAITEVQATFDSFYCSTSGISWQEVLNSTQY
jgi:hypothetical protein